MRHCSFKTSGDDADSVACLQFTSLGGYFVVANESGNMSVFKCGDGNKFSRILVADGEGRRKVVNIESVHCFVNSSPVTTSTWIKSASIDLLLATTHADGTMKVWQPNKRAR